MIAVELLSQIGLEKLNVQAFPLVRYSEAFESQARPAGAMKVVFSPQQ